jgi:hypothetical protein
MFMNAPPDLAEMLRYRRPANSGTERAFINRFLLPIGARPDNFGNLILRIGNAPVLWSSHTDTVHRRDGLQDIVQTDKVYKLAPTMARSNCLGADCTTGVWIMREMAKAKVPGLYVWHRAEEIGGLGSTYIATKTPELLEGINFAVAFDRKGTSSIITHQFGRCASETFTTSLAAHLPGFRADPNGIFTDTANYSHLISECTNLSIGYENAHGADETQDVAFPTKLFEHIRRLDVSKLIAARDPSAKEPFGYGWEDWGDDFKGNYYPAEDKRTLVDLIKDYPEIAADVMEQCGLTAEDMLAVMRTYRQ